MTVRKMKNYYKEIAMVERSIKQMHMQCGFRHEHADKMEIHPGQIWILCSVEDNPQCTQTDLARDHHISSASVGMSVKRLERAGLLVKQPDENDGRTTRLALTERGHKYARAAREWEQSILRNKFNGFSEEELAQYCGFLQRIKQNLTERMNASEELTDEADL